VITDRVLWEGDDDVVRVAPACCVPVCGVLDAAGLVDVTGVVVGAEEPRWGRFWQATPSWSASSR
jgi:hypothetical protein